MTSPHDPERRTDATLRRAAVVRIYEYADRMVVLTSDGGGHELSGDSAALARAVLTFLEHPHRPGDVLRHVESLAGGPLERPAVVDDLLALLRRAGAIEAVHADVAGPPRRGPGPRVLLGLTGAVASMHAPALVQRLQARGFEVRVAATQDALRFVRVEALEALTHRPVAGGMWPEGQVNTVPHIELAQWADVVVIAPASATTIARLAAGDYGSIVAAIALATRAPVIVAPSMNPAMYAGPPVQRNLERIAEDGLCVVHPARALEVAERPDERTPVLGGAPPPEVLVQVVESVLRARAAGETALPRGADGWDRLYRVHAPAELPWQRDAPDDDMLAELQRAAPAPTSVLEIGAGLGSLAVAAAARGHRVVAADVSSVALEHARARAPDAPVVWLQDDITDTRLRSGFQVVLDRGLLHVLAGDEPARYADAVARLTRPGGHLVLKTVAADAARVARPYGADGVRALLGGAFELERDVASALPGPRDAPPARLFVLRRR